MNTKDIYALLNNDVTITTKIEILPKNEDEEVITITQEDSIKSWTYNDFRYVEKTGIIGQFVARTLDGELQDITDDFNIQDREIILYLGIIRKDYTQEDATITTYYQLGNFYVEKPDSNEVNDNTKFQSSDYTILFNQKFNGDYVNDTYQESFNEIINSGRTVTAKWLLEYVCSQVDVELGTEHFTNEDFQIDSNQFQDTDVTCRDVVKAIAMLAYTWARIDWDNKLYLDFEIKHDVDADYNVIDNDYYYSLKTHKTSFGPVNRVLIGSSIAIGDNEYKEDVESVEKDGLCELDLYDNPLTYNENLRKIAINGSEKLFGLTYSALDMETTGHPWLKGNELICVVDMEGNDIYTYPFDRSIKYFGHIKTEIHSYADTDIQSNYSYNGDDLTESIMRKTRVELDRAEQKLNVYIGKVDGYDGTITDLTAQLGSISGTVTTLQDNYTATTTISSTAKGYPLYAYNAGNYNAESLIIYGKTVGGKSITGNIKIVKSYNEILENLVTQKTEEDILTQDSDNIQARTFEGSIINYFIPYNLCSYQGVRDTLDIITGTLTKYIGENPDGTLYLYKEPEILQCEALFLELYEGTNIIQIDSNITPDELYMNYLTNSSLNGVYASKTDLTISEKNVSISIKSDIQKEGVSKVTTETNFTFDADGLNISKEGAETRTLITEDGMEIYSTTGSGSEAMLSVHSEGVDAANISVENYFMMGRHSRFQDYEDGTGVFYIE